MLPLLCCRSGEKEISEPAAGRKSKEEGGADRGRERTRGRRRRSREGGRRGGGGLAGVKGERPVPRGSSDLEVSPRSGSLPNIRSTGTSGLPFQYHTKRENEAQERVRPVTFQCVPATKHTLTYHTCLPRRTHRLVAAVAPAAKHNTIPVWRSSPLCSESLSVETTVLMTCKM